MQSTQPGPCTVDGCERPIKRPRSGLCYGHYMKQWRHGDVHHQQAHPHADLAGHRYGALIALEYVPTSEAPGVSMWRCSCDCGATSLVRAGDLRSGNVVSCGNRPVHSRLDIVEYSTAHDRVRRAKGSATLHACVDCAGPARQWSYDHADPDELFSSKVKGSPAYSLDVEHYVARCVPCHRRFDLARARERHALAL